jgi:hypothetical protein
MVRINEALVVTQEDLLVFEFPGHFIQNLMERKRFDMDGNWKIFLSVIISPVFLQRLARKRFISR